MNKYIIHAIIYACTKKPEITIREKFVSLKPVFDEQSRRLWAAAEAKSLGHGGISIVARATGISRTTIHQGMKNLSNPKILLPRKLDEFVLLGVAENRLQNTIKPS